MHLPDHTHVAHLLAELLSPPPQIVELSKPKIRDYDHRRQIVNIVRNLYLLCQYSKLVSEGN